MDFTIPEVSEIIENTYGYKGDISQLPGEIDLNYLMITADDRRYTFKIANPGEKKDILEFQNAMMTHLLAKNLRLEIPGVIPSLKKEPITTINDARGNKRFIRLLSWVEGRPFATVNPHSDELLFNLGTLCGKLSKALADFDHPSAHRFIKWDLAQADWIKPHLKNSGDIHKQKLLDYFFDLYTLSIKPIAHLLRKSVIYNDANDYNVLVSIDKENPRVPGVIDFGDAVYSHTVNDLAIALAYAMMHKPNPLQAAHHIVKGYHSIYPLQENELMALFPLTCIRLLISVTCSQINREEEPDNVYLQISDDAAWKLLEKLYEIVPAFAYYSFRDACGMEPCPANASFVTWASKNATIFKPVIARDLKADTHWLDLGMGSHELGNQSNVLDSKKLHDRIEWALADSGKPIGLGRYSEVRPFYTSEAFKSEGNNGPEWRTVHIGLDIFAHAGDTIFAPIDGSVYSAVDNEGDRNYGPTIILKHEILPELTIYTLYGHLSRSSLRGIKEGDQIKGGEPIGTLGDLDENGGWSPHLHFQIILDTLGKTGDFPGVALPSQVNIWKSICPDPWLFIAGSMSPESTQDSEEKILSFRKQHLGKNLSLSYHKPLHMVRGYRQYLYAADGRKYLDTVNNVAHVGHEHPRVVAAGQRQMAVLNTNTRYLHQHIVGFTEALLHTMPPGLEVAFVVNSGSEANELALRLAKTYTNQKDMVVVEVGYHGNTNACVDVSSYKFDGKGGGGAPAHIHVVPIPDTYRGLYRDAEAGKKYASHIQKATQEIKVSGKGIAGFICESVLSCGGQIVLPDGYLKEAYRIVREAGGICIADEVQTGCGRAGNHFWAFGSQGVIPDVVTIGKPIGNGHPLGVVVTRREIADAFANGMEYFNTFGGNPVSCAIGREVLDVIKEEGLQQNALLTGQYLMQGLLQLKNHYPIVGDVRGLGLFLGIELVTDSELQPATRQAAYLANRMRELGVLMSTDGPFENVLKIKPPMVFGKSDSDFLLSTLERVLKEDRMKPD